LKHNADIRKTKSELDMGHHLNEGLSIGGSIGWVDVACRSASILISPKIAIISIAFVDDQLGALLAIGNF
jgi:hypothetical protein